MFSHVSVILFTGGVRVSLVTGTFLVPGGWGYGIGGGGVSWRERVEYPGELGI